MGYGSEGDKLWDNLFTFMVFNYRILLLDQPWKFIQLIPLHKLHLCLSFCLSFIEIYFFIPIMTKYLQYGSWDHGLFSNFESMFTRGCSNVSFNKLFEDFMIWSFGVYDLFWFDWLIVALWHHTTHLDGYASGNFVLFWT